MSFSINRAILLGNLSRDPELRMTSSGKAVLTLNLVTNHSYKKQDGMYEDVPTFHRVIVWGKMAEWLNNNLKKGERVYVDGRISTREYTNREGQKERIREIVAENVIPMAKQAKNAQNSAVPAVPAENPGESTTQPTETAGNENVNPEDIPDF